MKQLLNFYFIAKIRVIDFVRLHFIAGDAISIVRKIRRPPYGGGNQFCLALHAAANLRGTKVVFNLFNAKIKTYLVDGSYISKYQMGKLIELKKSGNIKIIHRIDGPTFLYKGDEGPDIISYEINKKLADITIFQSFYTKKSYESMGYFFENPKVVLNGFDSRFFYEKKQKIKTNKTKLIVTSWSDNEKKGKLFLEYIDNTIDLKKYQVTFVGRTKANIRNIKIIQPVDSVVLGEYLRDADIYLALSENDPCSNALCDALGCNLPVVYLNSGGHPELVGLKGSKISDPKDFWIGVDTVAHNISHYESVKSNVRPMNEVVQQYFS